MPNFSGTNPVVGGSSAGGFFRYPFPPKAPGRPGRNGRGRRQEPRREKRA
ncbi:MAG: hypothetical protein AVDCRST_MAG55-180 [uncultured Rubrobacteraceae bacterium]|uniref:Uncharacterized protein n=1 Tax=uncultured Rubrobacteraceae bacterium TaxID=349277 RepID=A0A6J4NUB1_9ACTN|nr:MAG: hypothetical protein AVDCRST_MAG55-180 [uncultured Rubrobacteraceae bacterium]